MSSDVTADLSRRERQILDALFALREGTVNDILDQLTDPPSYSAIRSALRVMVAKGKVSRRQDGPRYLYRPVVPQENAGSAALGHLVRTFFGGSIESAAAALFGLSKRRMTEDELKRLAERVDTARGEGV